MPHSLRCKRVCSAGFTSREVISRNGSPTMTGWTGHVAVLPGSLAGNLENTGNRTGAPRRRGGDSNGQE
jgi:hypothetical protein